MPCAHNKTWLKLLPVPTDTTQSGLVVPPFLPFLPSGSMDHQRGVRRERCR